MNGMIASILEIVDDMEKETGTCPAVVVAGYAKQIRRVIKAGSDSKPNSVVASISPAFMQLSEAAAKEQMRSARKEELSAPNFVDCVGGGSDGTVVDIPSDVPVGAKTVIDQEIYQLQSDGKMHYIGAMPR